MHSKTDATLCTPLRGWGERGEEWFRGLQRSFYLLSNFAKTEDEQHLAAAAAAHQCKACQQGRSYESSCSALFPQYRSFVPPTLVLSPFQTRDMEGMLNKAINKESRPPKDKWTEAIIA